MTNPNDVAAVIVEYQSGGSVVGCCASLRRNGVSDIVVVDNGDDFDETSESGITVLRPRVNLGYGRGANRGVAACQRHPYLIISNPDVVVHDGAVRALRQCLEDAPHIGVVGPSIVTSTGETYPSVRVFPSVILAGLHAICGSWWPGNPWTRAYRSPRRDGSVDWVSGAFFMIRRELFEAIGGFDEKYFMFAEDMDLCWRVARSGSSVAWVPSATVTHVEGVSRAAAPREMTIAHHRSAMRFEVTTARGLRRLTTPVAVGLLWCRMQGALIRRRPRN